MGLESWRQWHIDAYSIQCTGLVVMVKVGRRWPGEMLVGQADEADTKEDLNIGVLEFRSPENRCLREDFPL